MWWKHWNRKRWTRCFAGTILTPFCSAKNTSRPTCLKTSPPPQLAADPALKAALEQKKADDPAFAEDRYAQLNFVYERSVHNEAAYRTYPVRRLLNWPAASP